VCPKLIVSWFAPAGGVKKRIELDVIGSRGSRECPGERCLASPRSADHHYSLHTHIITRAGAR
jgi:hypothetical protein